MSPIRANHQIIVFKNYEELCRQTAQQILALSQEKIETKGSFNLALSGGVTPKGVYTMMGGPSYRGEFNWEKIHLFWGDERWVPSDHPLSNYHMVAEALLTKADIPIENIHPIRTQEKTAEDSASLYEKELNSFFGLKAGEFPEFDLILLGMGRDGHIASLFPNDKALSVSGKGVTAARPRDLDQARVTLTLPAINHSDNIMILVSGREKSEAIQKVFQEHEAGPELPVQKILAPHGKVSWLLDQGAAALLDGEALHVKPFSEEAGS